jgi:integrase
VQRQIRRSVNGGTVNTKDPLPQWAETIFVRSEASLHTTKTALWARSVECAKRYHRPKHDLEVDPTKLLAAAREGIDIDSYVISATAKTENFRRIRPEKVSMPPAGHPSTDGIGQLEWPYSDLFASLDPYRADFDVTRPTPPVGRVAMAEGESYGKLLQQMDASNMLLFFRPRDAPPGPANGLFAVLKGPDALRLILDGKPGNYDWDPSKLQRAYEELLAASPRRAAALGLDGRLMAMPDAAAFSQLPSGACFVALRDFSSYFYGIDQHPDLLGSQRLKPIDGLAIGREPGAWIPVMRVMSMGNWLSAMLAQLIHRATLSRMAKTSGWAKLPCGQTTARRRLVDALEECADGDGLVPVETVPAQLLDEFAKAHPGLARVPPGLNVPAAAFRLQVLTERPSADELAAGNAVELRLQLFHRGAQARFHVVSAEARARGEAEEDHATWPTLLCMLSAYIDDEAQTFYNILGRLEESQCRAACSLMTLMTIAAGGNAGLRENVKKLRWPSRDSGKHLGVNYTFTGDNRLEFEVAPARRQILAARLESLALSKARSVDVDVFDNLLGNVCWATMCHRSFFSIFRVAYVARHSERRPEGRVMLTPSLREELLWGSWAMPMLWSSSTRDAPRLTMYDASGAGKHGRGGFGVCGRQNLSELAAAEFMMPMGGQHGPLAAYLEPGPGLPPLDRDYDEPHHDAAGKASGTLAFDWEAANGPWRPAHRGEFKKAPPHINVAEAVTGVMACHHATRERQTGQAKARHGTRFVVGGDNTVACSCLTKGRSSRPALNFQCRRAAVYGFLYKVAFGWFWVPSKSNPADGPSRWWSEAHKRGRDGRLSRPGARDRRQRVRTDKPTSSKRRRAWVRDLWMDGDVHPHPGPSRARGPRRIMHPYCGRPFPKVSHEAVMATRPPDAALRLSVTPATYAKYLRALQGLNCYLADFPAEGKGYDERLAQFVTHCMLSEGAVTRARARTALTAVVFFDPALRPKTRLAWRAVDGWQAWKPTRRRVPIPDHINDYLALQLLSAGTPGSFDAGVAALVAQHTYCRGGEISELRVSDVFLPGHAGTFEMTKGLLHLRSTSGGTKGDRNGETVVIDSDRIIAALRHQVGGRAEDKMLFDFGKKSLLTWLKWAQAAAGYPSPVFVAHSWRHGGASGDRLHGRRTGGEIQLRGRWKDVKTMLIYLNSAATVLAEVACPGGISEYFEGDPHRADRMIRIIFRASPRE